MKKYLLIALLFCLHMSASAQSISFSDLTNLANLSDGQAHTYLTLGRVFKHQYLEEVDGKNVEHFRSINPKVAEQTIVIGVNKVLPNTAVLHTVTYTSRDPQHILNLVTQARHSRLTMQFQGADPYNNIYIFDNDFYRVSMYISTTENKGSVRIDQKEYVAY